MIFLQRHGESNTNVSEIYACRELDPDLTEQGLKEAQASVPFFAKVGIRKILSSPSRRAIQTANAISANLRCDIEINNLLMENHHSEQILSQVQNLAQAVSSVTCPVILVSNEVGTGIVPENQPDPDKAGPVGFPVQCRCPTKWAPALYRKTNWPGFIGIWLDGPTKPLPNVSIRWCGLWLVFP